LYQKLPSTKFTHTTAKLQISVSIPGYMNCFHFRTFVKGKKSPALFTIPYFKWNFNRHEQ